MAEVYRVTRSDGSVEFTDVPSGADSFRSMRPGAGSRESEADKKPRDHKSNEQLIRELQKRIPKLPDYLEYIDYLRHNSPMRFEYAMNELRREDPQAWLKLQKYPQFRPLRESALGLKAGSNLMEASVHLAVGKFAGSAEKWMESTLKTMMVRDRWGPHADVLGSKATTMPSKTTTYSNSRLGQHMKANASNVEAAGKAATKELALSQAGQRAAGATAAVRVFGPIVDFGVAALKPETGEGTLSFLAWRRLNKLAIRNPAIGLDTAAHETARQLLSTGQYGQLDFFLKAYE
jgi:hypothetical protein